MPPGPVDVLFVSGSTRRGSRNTALCRTAEYSAPEGVSVTCWARLSDLPHFNPDDDQDPLPPAVAALRRAIGAADAVMFCTPEYAGTLPGSLKNLLDWTVGGTEFSGKPVGWVQAAADRRRGAGAHATLATVLGYVQAAVAPDTGWWVPIADNAVDADGLIGDPQVRKQISHAITSLLGRAV